ncbi:MAG: potassium channel family protein [Candidatus Margulisbacteria bacterium]|jgi:voltage-gated potassium channel|nr:potassium channel family protein [Candidatus Margulisiibacteriota bacterium]
MEKKKYDLDLLRFQMNPLRRLIVPGLFLLAIVVIGVGGYIRLEGWNWIDALYMVTITLSTVGFREVHDLSPLGRLFTIGIIVTGVSTALYAAGQLIEIVLEGQIIGYRRRKKMMSTIRDLKDHYIICGFGRVGHQTALELSQAGVPCVVIDNKPEVALELEPQGIPHLLGDITSDAILKEAGIMTAKGLIASADSDTANVFVTLSARVLNPELYIIARAGYPDAEEKLKKAGANRVISPYLTAGKHMAEIAVKHRKDGAR